MPNFVVQNLRAAAGQRIEPGIPQTRQRIIQRQSADFRNIHDLRRRKTMAPDLEPGLDRPQQILIPFDLQLRMQPALHQNAGAAQVDGFLDLFEDSLVRMDVTLGVPHRPVERAEAAIFGAEIRVIDVAIDDVADHSFGMQLAADRVGRHSDPDQIVAVIQVDRFGAGHHALISSLSNREARSRYKSSPA